MSPGSPRKLGEESCGPVLSFLALLAVVSSQCRPARSFSTINRQTIIASDQLVSLFHLAILLSVSFSSTDDLQQRTFFLLINEAENAYGKEKARHIDVTSQETDNYCVIWFQQRALFVDVGRIKKYFTTPCSSETSSHSMRQIIITPGTQDETVGITRLSWNQNQNH